MYINVDMNHYQYIPMEEVPQNLTGFMTTRVHECVVGFISSDQGYGFFHYNRLNDPIVLAEVIKKDFQDATNIKVTLLGGNPGGLLFPWKANHRNVELEQWDSEYEKLYKHNEDAMIVLQKELVKDMGDFSGYFARFFLGNTNENGENSQSDEVKEILKTNLLKIGEDDNLITYDYTAIDRILKEKKFKVRGFDGGCTFTIDGVKDFVSYQNIAKLVDSFKNVCDFDGECITHFNTPLGFNVYAKFNGHITASGKMMWQDNTINEIHELPGFRIPNKKEFTYPVSMNKQPGFKFLNTK